MAAGANDDPPTGQPDLDRGLLVEWPSYLRENLWWWLTPILLWLAGLAALIVHHEMTRPLPIIISRF